MDTNKAIREFAELTLAEANKFMKDIKAELDAISKNTFAERLKDYFLKNPTVEFIVIRSYSQCSDDGTYYGISVGMYTNNDDEIEQYDLDTSGIDTDIFGMYEGMDEAEREIMYMRDFLGFNSFTVMDNDQEDEDEG